MKAWVSTYSNRPQPSSCVHKSQPWAAPATPELRSGKARPFARHFARAGRVRPTARGVAPAPPTVLDDESEIQAGPLAVAGRTPSR